MTGDAQQAVATAAGKMKVFISYSRRDVDFAGELELALTDKGYDPLVDRHDIDPGEKWKDRLGQLIFSCDTVVFVLSEHSAGSPICTWEVEEAARLGKRMLVVTPGAVPAGVAPPEHLQGINWIHCWRNPDVPGSSFMRGVMDLDRALKVDLGWLRQQTRLSEQAELWRARMERREDPAALSSMLLRGNALAEALDWMRATPPDASVPTLVPQFLEASTVAEAQLKAEAEAGVAEREKAIKTAEKANRRAGVFAWVAIVVALVLSATAVTGGYFAAQNYAASSAARSALFAREADVLFERGFFDISMPPKSMLMALEGDPAAGAGLIERWLNADGYGPVRVALSKVARHIQMGQEFSGHTGDVTSVAFHSDGERLLTGSQDGTVKLWKIGSEAPLETFSGHEGGVLSVAFHADSERFLTGARDGTAKLWRIGSEAPLATFRGHEGSISSVAFHVDGDRFLTGSQDGTAKLWRSGSDAPLATFSGHAGWVWSVAFHADGQRFLTGSADGTVTLWRIESDTPLATIRGHERAVSFVGFHPDGERFLTGSWDGTVKLWAIGADVPLATFQVGSGVESVAFHPSGEHFLTGSSDQTVKLWRTSTAAPLATFQTSVSGVDSIAFHPDGKRFLIGAHGPSATLWQIGEMHALVTKRGVADSEEVRWVTFHPDGDRFLTGSQDGTLKLWRIGSEVPLVTFSGHEDYASSAVFHPDGEHFLTGSWDRTAKLWRIGSDTPVATFSGHESMVQSVALHPDGERFLTASNDRTVKLWRIGSDAPLATYRMHEAGADFVAFHPDGERFLTWSGNGMGQLWRIGESQALTTYSAVGPTSVTSVAFHPDGERFLTGSDDGTVGLWRIGQAKAISTFSRHEFGVNSVAFHPDGEHFLSGSYVGTAYLWRIGQPKTLAEYHAAVGSGVVFGSLVIYPDGERFETRSSDGTTKLWQIPKIVFASADEQVRIACETLRSLGVMDFSQGDWQRFPILDRNAPHPCRHVWGFDPRKGETGAVSPG